MTIVLTADVPLSRQMREGSRLEHRAAEGSSFVGALLDGRVDHRGYAAYLARLHRVYVALEDVGRALAGDALAAAVLDPALERRAALEADLAVWAPYASAGTTDAAGTSPATDAYVARIHASAAWAGLFVAHHYTRYLGDLSGGQAIGRVLARTYGLHDGAGLAFYAFPAIPAPKPWKDAYRARLDALPLDPVEQQRVVDEVRVVFGLNGALLAELSGLCRPASG